MQTFGGVPSTQKGVRHNHDCTGVNSEGQKKLLSLLSMTGDVAQWLEHRNSNPKTLGSIPWLGRVRGSISVSPSQLLCCVVLWL